MFPLANSMFRLNMAFISPLKNNQKSFVTYKHVVPNYLQNHQNWSIKHPIKLFSNNIHSKSSIPFHNFHKTESLKNSKKIKPLWFTIYSFLFTGVSSFIIFQNIESFEAEEASLDSQELFNLYINLNFEQSFNGFLKLAKTGDYTSIIYLIHLLQFGHGTPINKKHVSEWISYGLKKFPNDILLNGLQTILDAKSDKDLSNLYESFQNLLIQKYSKDSDPLKPVVLFSLARFAGYGFGTRPDTDQSHKYMVQAANLGFPAAKLALSALSLSESFDSQAFTQLKTLGQKNDPSALYLLATISFGLYFDKHAPGKYINPINGLEFLRRASEMNHLEAMYLYGTANATGVGGIIPSDHDLAITMIEKAADQGHVEAIVDMSTFHLNLHQQYKPPSDLFKPDPNCGLSYLLTASQKGHPRAQYMLGTLYQFGHDDLISVDFEKAEKWITLSASQKYPPALFALGKIRKNQGKTTQATQLFYQAKQLGYS